MLKFRNFGAKNLKVRRSNSSFLRCAMSVPAAAALMAVSCTALATDWIAECDRLASAPEDYQRTAPPVDLYESQASRAEFACRNAVAEKNDSPRLAFQLARVLLGRGEPIRALEYLQSAAELNYAAAQLYLGLGYQSGWFGKRDLPKAFRWVLRAAEAGNQDAQHVVAVMYQTGQGVERNEVEAFRWQKQAAEQGDLSASTTLGQYYIAGTGTEINIDAGVRLLEYAANNGEKQAQFTLGTFYLMGRHVTKDEQRGLELLHASAKQDNPLALAELGKLYYEGDVVTKDHDKAISYFCKAGAYGRVIFENEYYKELSCKKPTDS